MSDWQSIETAPRDGTRILGFGGGMGQIANVISYNERVGCWDTPYDTLDDRDEEENGYIRPTHWMPLPAPPTLTWILKE